MASRVLTAVFCVLLSFSFAPVAVAQGAEANAAETKTSGPRKQISTIVFAGLAGAVLGLSTLSFYGRPQDKLANIAVGAAVGIISGAIYTTYQAAAEPSTLYGEPEAMRAMETDRMVAEVGPTWSIWNQEWTF